jgi:hypothetical protein
MDFTIQPNQNNFDIIEPHLSSPSEHSVAAMPNLFMDDLQEALPLDPDLSIHALTQHMPSSGQKESGHHQVPTSPNRPYCSPGHILECPDSQATLNGLLELQTRLVQLVLRFCGHTNTAGDIGDLYRLTQRLGTIMAQSDDSSTWDSNATGPDFGGVQVLLISSCYFSLIQAYQRLVDILAAQVNQPSAQGFGHTANAELAYPTISIEGLRLHMPGSAAAEVNLHIAAQTLQYLRSALEHYNKRRICEPDSAIDVSLDIDDEEAHGGRDHMKSMVSDAVEQLRDVEEGLFDNLHALAGVTNNRLFNLR